MNFGPTIGKVPLASPYDNIHDEECLGKLVLKMGRTMDASGIILAYFMFFIDFISLSWI